MKDFLFGFEVSFILLIILFPLSVSGFAAVSGAVSLDGEGGRWLPIQTMWDSIRSGGRIPHRKPDRSACQEPYR